MDSKSQNLSVYSAQAGALAKKFNGLDPYVAEIKQVFSLLRKNNPTVLELGCGSGRDAKEILKYTKNYLGIDLTPELLEIAKEANPGGDFKIADLEQMPFPQNLDAVFAFASLLHSPKEVRPKIFEKVWEALNPKGIFCFSVKVFQQDEVQQTDEFGTRIFYSYNESDIKNLAKDLFEIITLESKEVRGQEWLTAILKKLI